MKRTKTKIAVSAFALLVGASLAGSISGTIAWYQFSTKVYGAYIGTAGGTSGNLQMRIKGTQNWTTRLSYDDVDAYLQSALNADNYGTNVQPITSGSMLKNGAIGDFYANPVLGKAEYANWQKANKTNYVFLPLELRYVERDGKIADNESKDEKNIKKEVYLSDLTIQEDVNNTTGQDLSEAIRFHVASYSGAEANPQKSNFLISKNGGTTLTAGRLDLDGDKQSDKAYEDDDPYGFNGSTLDYVTYGDGKQVAYAASNATELISGQYYEEDVATPIDEDDIHPILAKDDGASLTNKVYGDDDTSKAIGKTLADEEHYLNVEITIWVEGWQKFMSSETDDQGNTVEKISSSWDASYIGSKFDVGFQFAVDPAE